MIFSNHIEEMDAKILQKILDESIEAGKCVEIYMIDSMLYIQKMNKKKYVYGYYPKMNGDNTEWIAQSCDTYILPDKGFLIEFIDDNEDYEEIRTFHLNKITTLYVGDKWSN